VLFDNHILITEFFIQQFLILRSNYFLFRSFNSLFHYAFNIIMNLRFCYTLENLAIIRANNKYYGKPCFNNVSVRMNSVVQLQTSNLYGCSRLKLTEIYSIIDIEAIKDIIHIIPRFNSNNEYFVNKFIF